MTDGVASTAGGPVGSGAPGPQIQPPVRPTWSPVEEARKKAEFAMAAAAANGTAAVAPTSGKIKAPHHTLIPRMLVLVGIVATVVGVLSNELLVWLGEAQELQGRVEYTERGRLARIALLGGPTAAYVSGWVWWTAAASANARHKSRNAGSPAFAPTTHGVLFLLIAVAVTVPDSLGDRPAILLTVGLIATWLLASIGVLLAFRGSAAVIKAPTKPWSRMLWLPLAVVVVPFVVAIMGGATGSVVIILSAIFIWMGLVGWYVASVATAMRTFDQACRTPNIARGDGEVPAFMRMAMAPR